MIRQRNWLPQGGRRPLAPGTRVEDVAAELAYLHSRYPTMRTRLAFDRGEVRQWLVSSGETSLELYNTPADQDPDDVAAAVEAVYRRRPYDLRSEWPIRMAVVRDGQTCSHLVVLMHHLALDAGGAAIMLREVAVREVAEPVGMQPLEQAAWQSSEAGRRHNDRTLRYFVQALRTIPVRPELAALAPPGPASTAPVSPDPRLAAPPDPRLAAPADPWPAASRDPVRAAPALAGPREPRHWSGRLISPALAAAVTAIGARTGVDDSAVLTAAVGIAFARLSGTDHVLIRPRVGNRFRPALADVVCFVAQSGLLVLDLAGTTFDEAVARARSATMAAVKHAYFDPDALQALLDRSPAAGSIAVFVNDRRSAKDAAGYASETAPDPLGRAPSLARSTFAWLHSGAEPTEPLSVTLDDADGALAVTVHFDTHALAPERVEELAWGVERAAVEAAADGSAATGVGERPAVW
jgi:hypothetical protein